MKYYAVTNPGSVRENNEDSIRTPESSEHELNAALLQSKGHLFVVCDGLGGHNAGEVASAMAGEHIMQGWYGEADHSAKDSNRLKALVRVANSQILQQSHQNSAMAGMATTLTSLLIKDDMCTIAHIGDSRAYLFRQNELMQLTDDHSPVWQYYKDGLMSKDALFLLPGKHQLTQALGFTSYPEIDIVEFPLAPHSIFLLCTDGLTDMLSDDDLAMIIEQETDLETIGDALLEAALSAGGYDNVSFILIEI